MLGYGTGFGNSPDEKGLDFVVWPGIKAGPKAPRVGGGLGSDALISQVHSEGGIWTHFPDRVAYRFIEVRRLC